MQRAESSVLESPNQPESTFHLATFQPVELTNLQEVYDLINDLISKKLIPEVTPETSKLSKLIDPKFLAKEFLISADGKTFRRSHLNKLTELESKRFPIYFIKVDDINRELIDIEAAKTTASLLTNLPFAEILCNINLKHGSVTDYKLPVLSGSYDHALLFVNPLYENLLWVLCQELIRKNNFIFDKSFNYTTSYQNQLNDFKNYFSAKQNEIKNYLEFLETLRQAIPTLNNLINKELSPEDLQKVLSVELSIEADRISLDNWKNFVNDKLVFDPKKLSLATAGFLLAALVTGSNLLAVGAVISWQLIMYRHHRVDQLKDREAKVEDVIKNIAGQAPTMNYLIKSLQNDFEMLNLKLATIVNELQIIKQSQSTIVIQELNDSYLKRFQNLVFWGKSTINSSSPTTIKEVEEVEKSVNFTSDSLNLSTDDLIIQDVTDDNNHILLKRP